MRDIFFKFYSISLKFPKVFFKNFKFNITYSGLGIGLTEARRLPTIRLYEYGFKVQFLLPMKTLLKF